MKRNAFLLVLILVPVSVFSAVGDTISEFTVSGQPSQGIRGLEKDWVDGHIWYAGPDSMNNCNFAKFHLTNHSLVKNWKQLKNHVWVYDIAYPYRYNNTDCIIAVDQVSPRLRLYNPQNGNNESSFSSDPFTGGENRGLGANPGTQDLFATNGSQMQVMRWNGLSWSNFASYSEQQNAGVCYGWHHIFVIYSMGTFKIKVFNEGGENVANYNLNNWGGAQMMGLACGRENGVGANETLFTAVYYPISVIREIEIGDFNKTEIITASIGDIKSIFH
ncbi:MAG: hypothetical protein ACUVWP_06735 [bacterium]